MGWKRPAAARHALLTQHYVDPSKCGPYAAVVVDACSESRRIGCGPRPESAEKLCARMFRGLAKKCTSNLVVMFDCQQLMHEARAGLHASRYPKLDEDGRRRASDAGKIIVGGRAFSPGSEPYRDSDVAVMTTSSNVVWNRLWASSAGKERAWSLIYDGLIVAIHAHAKETLECVLWYRGSPFVWPYNKKKERAARARILCANTYGEGDQRVCEAAQALAGFSVPSVLVQTVDTDMLIQVLCAENWHGLPILHIQLKNEVVDATSMCHRFGPGWGARINTAFWLLASAGVDYCRGLARFGYATAALEQNAVRQATASRASRVVRATGNSLTIDVGKLFQELEAIPRRKMQRAMAADFNSEVGQILFCIALFSGASRHRLPCGGPLPPNVQCFVRLAADALFNCGLLRRISSGSQACLSVTHDDLD